MKKSLIIFILITLVSIFIRFWNFEDNINFHLDPPLFMQEMKDIVDAKKISLIGPMVSSKVLEGRGFFTGPTMYYILIPIALATNWNVEILTAFFGLIWLVFFVLLYFWIRKKFGATIGLLVYAIASFSPWLVPHARIIWNPAFIPLFALLLMFCLEKRKEHRVYYFMSGLAFGLGLSIEYIAIALLPILLYFLISEIKDKSFRATNWLLLFSGFLLGEAPLILFEFRHNFYNLQTIFFHLANYKPSQTYDFRFRGHFYYYIFPFLPLFFLFYAKVLAKIQKRFGKKILIFSQVLIMVLFLARLILGPRDEALINPHGWTIARQKQAVDLITYDNEKIFEVATTLGPDTRAGELRWWLRQKGTAPMGVEDYESATILYLVAPESRPPEKENVWEVKSLKPFNEEWKIDIGDGYFLYKLRRQPKTK